MSEFNLDTYSEIRSYFISFSYGNYDHFAGKEQYNPVVLCFFLRFCSFPGVLDYVMSSSTFCTSLVAFD